MMRFSRRTGALVALLFVALGIRDRGSAAGQGLNILASAGQPAALGSGAVRIVLTPRDGPAALRQAMARLSPEQQVFLVLGDLHALAQPGVVFDVYFGLPPGPVPADADARQAGTLNFFAVTEPDSGQPVSRSYDVTKLVRGLVAEGWPADRLAVTIVPDNGGAADPASSPSIGRVELILQ
jgi:hypothetical protein